MDNGKITSENVWQQINALENSGGDVTTQALCWVLIYQFCFQNGMNDFDKERKYGSGIEKVIAFLETLITKTND